VGGNDLRIALTFAAEPDGSYAATMTSVDSLVFIGRSSFLGPSADESASTIAARDNTGQTRVVPGRRQTAR
jgi:hypothetical protein